MIGKTDESRPMAGCTHRDRIALDHGNAHLTIERRHGAFILPGEHHFQSHIAGDDQRTMREGVWTDGR